MNSNIFACNFCDAVILAEERVSHKCRKVAKKIKVDQNRVLVYDGVDWYPLKSEKIPMSRLTRLLSCPEDFDRFEKRKP